MKKLMVMMAAVATGFAAWASALSQQVAYTVDQSLAVGPTNIVGYSDDLQKKVGDHDAVIHWWMDGFIVGTDEDPISIAEGEVTTDAGILTKVLQLETGADTPVLRTFNELEVTTGDIPSIDMTPVDIQDHGTFIDTWVKLSASEGVQEPVEGDKISIWLQVVDEETDDQGAVVVPASTNLVVTCGALDSAFNTTPTNIVLDADVEPDTWHRVTIRAVKQIASSSSYQNIGFVVFLDEHIVAAKEGAYLDFTGIALSDKAQAYAQNRQLFPSLQKDTAATLTAAGFAGVGQIASVNLDTQYSAPAFAKDPTFVTISWDAHVESIKLGGQDGQELIGEAAIGETNIQVLAFGVDATQTLAIKYADTYKCDKVTGSANLAAFTTNDACTSVTFALNEYANGLIDIDSIIDRIEAVVTIDDGDPISFTTLAAALADSRVIGASGRVVIITLGEDVAQLSGLGYLADCSADEVVIDLAGNTIQGTFAGGVGDEDVPYLFDNAGVLTIMDSVGGGQMIAPEDIGLILNEEKLTIEQASLGDAITFVGAIVNDWYEDKKNPGEWIGGTLTVLGGNFSEKVVSNEDTQPEGGITLGTTAAPLCWLAPETSEDYYTLIPMVAFSVVKPANTTISIADANGAAVAENDKIDPNATYTVTINADTGYEWKDVVPAVTEKTETFVFTDNAEAGVITLKTAAPVPAAAETVTYTITDNATVTLAITNGGAATQALTGNVVVGDTLTVVATAAEGYEYDGNEDYGAGWNWNDEDKSWTFTKTAEKDAPISVTVLPAPAITYVAQVGDTKYRTLAGAIEAAAANQTVTLLTGITLTETLTIAKQTAINLDGCTVTFGDGLKNGIVTTADTGNLVISNGYFTVAGTRPAKGYAFMLDSANATFKDVTMDLTGFEYGLEAEKVRATKTDYWDSSLERCTITCENVDVTGNGSLFHFENVIATLDADCSATLKAGSTPFGAAHNAAIYSSCGATVTVAGGNYSHQVALQTGDLGGTLIVNGGTFTGDIKSFMGNREQRSVTEWNENIGKITITGGTFDGNFVEVVPGSEKTVWDIKGGTFSADPTKYLAANYATIKNANDKWDVGLAIIATFMVDDAIYTAQTNIVAFKPATPTDPEKPNYTFKGWNPEIDVIAENTTYAAQFSANPALLTLPASPTGVVTMEVYESDDAKATWKPVTIDDGAYPIAAGNHYKVAVTAETGYELKDPAVDAIISDAAVTPGDEIAIEAADLAALVQLRNYNIIYKQVNEQPITGLNPATFTIAAPVTLPNDLGAQVGGTFEGWYANAELTGDPITGWAAGAKTADVTVYAKIKQVVDEPAEIVKDKVDTTGLDDTQVAAAKVNATIIYTAKGNNKAAAEAWITSVYGEGVKIDGAKLAAASAENVEIAMKYDIEIMEDPVIEFNATVAATEGNVAAFTFQIKDGDEGDPISLAAAETAGKVLSMVQYCSTLGSWAPATSENVAVSVDDDTAKVELVKKNGVAAGFMKVVLTADK